MKNEIWDRVFASKLVENHAFKHVDKRRPLCFVCIQTV